MTGESPPLFIRPTERRSCCTPILLCAGMVLEYLDFPGAAQGLRTAMARVYVEGKLLTPD